MFGLAFGSFANVLIYRLPRRQSILKPQSHCPACENPIKFYDNIPIISYIILRGRCRHCGAGISFKYAMVEAIMGLIFFGLTLKYGVGVKFFFYAVFAFAMVVHAFIDLEHYLLLDRLNIAGGAVGLAFILISPRIPILDGAAGMVFGGGLLGLVYLVSKMLFKKEGMGLGDIKTGAVCGLFLGPISVIYMLLLAAVMGLIWGLGRLIAGKGRIIPFGTLMGAASIVMVFWGKVVYGWVIGG